MKISEKRKKCIFFQNSCTELAKIKNLHSTICLKVFPSSGRVALSPAFAQIEGRGASEHKLSKTRENLNTRLEPRYCRQHVVLLFLDTDSDQLGVEVIECWLSSRHMAQRVTVKTQKKGIIFPFTRRRPPSLGQMAIWPLCHSSWSLCNGNGYDAIIYGCYPTATSSIWLGALVGPPCLLYNRSCRTLYDDQGCYPPFPQPSLLNLGWIVRTSHP